MPIWKWDETISAAEIIDPIEFTIPFEFEIQNSGISLVLLDGISLNLIQNDIKIPLILDISSYLIIDLNINFEITSEFIISSAEISHIALYFQIINGLEIGVNYQVINSLYSILEQIFVINNSLTDFIEISLSIPNKLLRYNEVNKVFSYYNRLGLSQDESYNVFYFSKIHGV